MFSLRREGVESTVLAGEELTGMGRGGQGRAEEGKGGDRTGRDGMGTGRVEAAPAGCSRHVSCPVGTGHERNNKSLERIRARRW